jgi:hypothetical protein
MIFEIAGISIVNFCNPPQINKTHRSQAVNTSLNGYTLIDRIGGHKFSIHVEIPFITSTIWYVMVASLESVAFNIRFDFGGETHSKFFRLDGDIPSPMIFSKNNQSYYSGISLKLEEM